jgi:hypothetical protein
MRMYSMMVGAGVMLLLATVAAFATPCPSTVSCLRPAPAPLLAAGIPAFLALGGGVTAHRLWRKFVRRS